MPVGTPSACPVPDEASHGGTTHVSATAGHTRYGAQTLATLMAGAHAQPCAGRSGVEEPTAAASRASRTTTAGSATMDRTAHCQEDVGMTASASGEARARHNNNGRSRWSARFCETVHPAGTRRVQLHDDRAATGYRRIRIHGRIAGRRDLFRDHLRRASAGQCLHIRSTRSCRCPPPPGPPVAGDADRRAPPFRPRPGILGWTRSGLTDLVAWRARAFLVLKLPVALVDAVVAGFLWIGGLYYLTYPLWWGLFHRITYQVDATGRRESVIGVPLPLGHLSIRTAPGTMLIAAVGVAALLAAPWATRAAVALDRWLIRWLLGPRSRSERIRDLERPGRRRSTTRRSGCAGSSATCMTALRPSSWRWP